jgi:hemophore-related protein
MTGQLIDQGDTMLPATRRGRRAMMGVVGFGAMACAWTLAAGSAGAQPPMPVPIPPPCTAAELARVMSGVTFETSNYLTRNPPVNDFFTSLKGQPKNEIGEKVQVYLDANPAVRADLQRIRQPSVDFRQRCGAPVTP